MLRKKIVCFLLCLSLMMPMLSAQSKDWKEDIPGYLGEIRNFDVMKTFLEFKLNKAEIPDQEKGAAFLLLAYAHYECKDEAEEIEKKRTEEKGQLRCFERYLKEFQGKDDDLNFLKRDCPEERKSILKFRDDLKRGFPVIYGASILKETQDLKPGDYVEMNYFSPAPEIFVKLDISTPCHYEIYDVNEELLDVGRSKGDFLIVRVPINENFFKIESGKYRYFRLVLAEEYRNEKIIRLQITHDWSRDKFEFSPETGKIKIIETVYAVEMDENGFAIDDVHREYYKSKFNLKAKEFRKHVLPNLLVGGVIFLFKKVADDINNTSPAWDANIDGSKKIFNTMAIGFSLKGVYNLFAKKAYPMKKIKRRKFVMTKEDYNEEIAKQKNQYKQEVTVAIKINVTDK